MEGVSDKDIAYVHHKYSGSTSSNVRAGLGPQYGVVVGVHGWVLGEEGGGVW